jgi:hypothetical protein
MLPPVTGAVPGADAAAPADFCRLCSADITASTTCWVEALPWMPAIEAASPARRSSRR